MPTTRLYTALLTTFIFLATADLIEAQTITHVPLYTFNGDSAGDRFGQSVSGAGDVNGDGFDDLIVGAILDDNNGDNSGSARVLSGEDGSVLYNFNGDSGDFPLSNFGFSVSGAGDVNNDGFADLIVGARFDNNSGSARVLSGIDGSILHDFDADSENDLFGESVSGAGDVNDDGFADVIVGASSDNNNGPQSGSARVLSGLNGSVLYDLNGDSLNDRFGTSVSGAGDVNNDGFDDLIVGAPNDDDNGENSGSARVLSGSNGSVLYIFFGDSEDDQFGTSVSDAGDVNNDGFDDLIVGAPFDDNNGDNSGSARVLSGEDGSVLYNFNGDREGGFGFGESVSGAGDVNNDGFADLIVGIRFDDDNGNNSGSVRVLSGIDGGILYSFTGDSAGDIFGGDLFGGSVSGAGDVNGDGIDDFIVGASGGGANDGGYARVFVSQISSVPEPASTTILLLGCGLAGMRRWRSAA